MRTTFPNNLNAGGAKSSPPKQSQGNFQLQRNPDKDWLWVALLYLLSPLPQHSQTKTKCTIAHLRKNQELANLLKWTASKPKPFSGEDVDTAQKTEENRKSVKIWGRPSEGIHPSTLPRVLTSLRESGTWKCSLSDPVFPQQRMTHKLPFKTNPLPQLKDNPNNTF